MRAKGRRVFQVAAHAQASLRGTFVAPTLIEIESLADLSHEVFGPVLHVLSYRREGLDALVDAINALGYGLTLGIHSRVDDRIEAVAARARVGNIYVNRNIVGAVVGVQPFGGEGLSGTGPKAGGPLYLYRLLASCPPGAALEELRSLDRPDGPVTLGPARASLRTLAVLRGWDGADERLRGLCERLTELSPLGGAVILPGPTGERNSYAVMPRTAVLCLASAEADLLAQLAAVLSVGGRAVWPRTELTGALWERLPALALEGIERVADWTAKDVEIDAILHHGSREERLGVLRQAAARPGPIASVHAFEPGEPVLALERLLLERVVSVNTAAAGGNASLMTVG